MWREAHLSTAGNLWEQAMWAGGVRSCHACGVSCGSPFTWSDGTPFTFAPWRQGEPNNGGCFCAEEVTALWPQGDMNDSTGRCCLTCPLVCACLPAVYAKDVQEAANAAPQMGAMAEMMERG